MAKELSAVQRCKKNKWEIGTVLKTLHTVGVFKNDRYYEITGFGKYEVIGFETNLSHHTTTSEKILPINGDHYSAWRKSNINFGKD